MISIKYFIIIFLLTNRYGITINGQNAIATNTSLPLTTGNGIIQVKVGFVAATQQEVQALSLIMQDLRQTVGIDSQLNLSFAIQVNCSNFNGPTQTASLYFQEKINALIGPACSKGLDCTAMMAATWNLPMISYITGDQPLTDKTKYQTLANVNPTGVNTFCDSILALLTNFGWQKIALLYNGDNSDVMLRVKYVQQRFTEINVQILNVELPANTSAFRQREFEMFSQIKQYTRVLLIMHGLHLSDSQCILRLLHAQGFTVSEYVMILPWLERAPDEPLPWIGINGTINETCFTDFVDTIVVDSDRDGTNVTRRFGKILDFMNITNSTNTDDIAHYFTLYDALKLFIIAANTVSKNFGPQSVLNGTTMWNGMREVQFEGASGTIVMDTNADRLPYYAAYSVSASNKSVFMQLADITPQRVPNCNRTGTDDDTSSCFAFNITNMNQTLWNRFSQMGQEPVCGYDGSKCSNSNWLIVMAVLFGSALLTGAVVYAWKRDKKRVYSRLPWLIPSAQIELIGSSEKKADDAMDNNILNQADEQIMETPQKVHSNSDLLSIRSLLPDGGRTIAKFGGSIVKLEKYKQLKNISLDNDEAAAMITQIKQLVHDNINPLVGLTCNNPNCELLFLWKGLEYIHNSPMGYHGSLDPSKCVIDSNFVVKIVAVGVNDLIAEWRRNGIITDYEESHPTNDQQNADTVTVRIGEEQINNFAQAQLDPDDTIYRAPELLRRGLPSRFRQMHMSKADQHRFKGQGRSADMYTLAMLMYEVLFRQRIFEEVNLPQGAIIAILKNSGDKPFRPELPKVLNKEHHPVILQVLQQCWSEMPVARPNIRHVKKAFFSVYKISGGLVQSVLQLMDQHAHSLEKQVRERTRLLEEAQIRADRLLSQMLPKDVARDLKLGRPVIPRSFPSASILFTDIVSFTNICAASTPMEIVSFLNDLFTGYDDITGQLDAFKVETIGDAYMVVSGVPKENGTEHARQIALIALRMRRYLLNYKLPHMPDHKMQARWGLHTGSVAAGVVGLTAPRYCLFGDTVNMASRMESSGEPGRIQMSSDLHDLIESRGDPFSMEERGLIKVKGKGECVTFWLLDPDEEKKQQV